MTCIQAVVAQSVERILGKDKVTGSIPVNSSTHGGLAQLARACGSYPQCPEFESPSRHHTDNLVHTGLFLYAEIFFAEFTVFFSKEYGYVIKCKWIDVF